ncbi:hypothetical protein DXX92_01225 [Thalassotalea euphylliae]|uniref:Uncharacterized protein n=1 Tax=Thalassotalea euphylliae TaxID=1655234 RepID=A0A3E0UB71_9GAMM|nr:hypothetical protein DXX92_01225 [Thalassotalea euphylliae]
MNPQGSVCLNFLLCWHLFMENDYTAQVPPCIKPKQTAAKTTLKAQHALVTLQKSFKKHFT